MVNKEKDFKDGSSTSHEVENTSVDGSENNSDGSTETESEVNGIKAAFEQITDISWDDTETIYDDDDDEDFPEDVDENQSGEIRYTIDDTINPEEVGKEIHHRLSRWIENEMQLSTIIKMEAATAMNLVFFNDQQCQEYKGMIQAVQEALNQLSSGIWSKVENHVCFYGVHHKSLFERHLKTESRNAMDDLDNFFDPEKCQDETTDRGRQLTEQGMDKIIKLFRKENDDVVEYERKLAVDSIDKMKQCFRDKFRSTLSNNRNEIENKHPSLEEIQKRMKYSCSKSFNEAFGYGERVNEVQAVAGKGLDTDIEKEMQQVLERMHKEKDFGAHSSTQEPENATYKTVEIPQEVKNAQLKDDTIEVQQVGIPQHDKKKPEPTPKPQPVQKINQVAATQIQLQNVENYMQPLNTPKLVVSRLSNDSSKSNSIQQMKETLNLIPIDQRIENFNSSNTEKQKTSFDKVYNTCVPAQQGMKLIEKNFPWTPCIKNLKPSGEATEKQREEFSPTQKTEPSPKSKSPLKTNNDRYIQQQLQNIKNVLQPDDNPQSVQIPVSKNSSKGKSTHHCKESCNSIDVTVQPPEKAAEDERGENPPFQKPESSRKTQSPQKTNKINIIQLQTQNTTKRVQTPLSKNLSMHKSTRQVKTPSNLAKASVSCMGQKLPHTKSFRTSLTTVHHHKGKVDLEKQSKLPSVIQTTHNKAVLSPQKQPAYRNVRQSHKDQLRQHQDKQVGIISKKSGIQTFSVQMQNPKRNTVHRRSTAKHGPAINNCLHNAFTKAKNIFSKDSASDNNQNAATLSKPKNKATEKQAAAPCGTSITTQRVENNTKLPRKTKSNTLFEQKLKLKLKCNEMDVLIKNQKFVVGSDTLLIKWKKLVAHSRHIAAFSLLEENISRQIEIIERTRGDLLKAVDGSRY